MQRRSPQSDPGSESDAPTVLVAVDESDAAARGVDHALAVAASWDGRLHVVHARPPAEAPPTDPPTTDPRRAQALVLTVAERALDRGIPVEAVVRPGRPHRVIASYAEEINADLVVLGARTDADYRGSVASRVATATDRAVAPV
ncbi:universal stress protein [Halosegnis sp.]|uniref:universal stress protein n=1 Tax=Halosegnis sp. TaxID=2864959 RepID=UPI0035D3F74A